MSGGIDGRVVFDYATIFACQQAAGFVGVTGHHVGQHLIVHCPGDTHDKLFITGYHRILASKSSSSSSRSRVHKSSLRYFQPASARMTTILPCSKLSAARNAACRAAPHDGPAKMPSWSLSWRVRRMASTLVTSILASIRD